MKKQTLLLAGAALAAAFGLASCQKDINGPDNKAQQEQGDVYASFSITLPNDANLLKAEAGNVGDAADGDTYVGTKAEQFVKDILIVLYDESNTAAYQFDMVGSNINGTDTQNFAGDSIVGGGGHVNADATQPTATVFTTNAQRIKKGTYTAYVFLNRNTTNITTNTTVGKPLSELMKAQPFTLSNVVDGAKGIFMSNAKGPLTLTPDDFYPTAAEAEKADNSINIAVDRAVAKIFVNGSGTGGAIPLSDRYGNDLGTGTITKFTVGVQSKSYFYVRQFDYTSNSVTRTTGMPTEKETATSARGVSYAKDPNMGKGADGVDFSKDPADMSAAEKTALNTNITGADGFTYPTEIGTVSTDLLAQTKAAGWADANGIYVPENTMNADQQYELCTTQVYFEINYVPNGFSAGDSYVAFKGMYFTIDDVGTVKGFKSLVTEAQNKINETNTDGTQKYTFTEVDELLGVPAGFTEAVATPTGTPGSYTFQWNTDHPNASAYSGTGAKSFEDNDVKFYLNGLNYYKLMIRHFNNTQVPWASGEPLQYGRYGVVRNNIYKLTVTKISGPGEPLIPTPDPEDPPIPDDKDDNYVSFEVSINPWLVRSMEYEL